MITYVITGRGGLQPPVGIIKGIPAGMRLQKSYVGHQVTRWEHFRNQRLPLVRKDRIVTFRSGWRGGRTTGGTITIAISDELLSRLEHAGLLNGRLSQQLLRIACNTVIRKYLEDRGVFVGSHVIKSGQNRRRHIGASADIRSLLRASCGAYKITELADKSPGRILQIKRRQDSRRQDIEGLIQRDPGKGEFEIVITGIKIDPSTKSRRGEQLVRRIIRAVRNDNVMKTLTAKLWAPSNTSMPAHTTVRKNMSHPVSEVRLRIRTRSNDRVRHTQSKLSSRSRAGRQSMNLGEGGVPFQSVMTESTLPEILIRLGIERS